MGKFDWTTGRSVLICWKDFARPFCIWLCRLTQWFCSSLSSGIYRIRNSDKWTTSTTITLQFSVILCYSYCVLYSGIQMLALQFCVSLMLYFLQSASWVMASPLQEMEDSVMDPGTIQTWDQIWFGLRHRYDLALISNCDSVVSLVIFHLILE